MKIAHFVCRFPPYKGGIGNVCYYQAKYLSKLGNEVVVFTHYNRKEQGQINRTKENFKVKALPYLFAYGNASLCLPVQIKQWNQFDVIHLHFPFIGFAEQLLFLKKIGLIKPYFVVQYHMDLVGQGIIKHIFSFYNKFTLPLLLSADKIIASSLDYLVHSKISKYYQKGKNKFEVIPLGIDENKFFPLKKKLENKKNLEILFVGGLDKAHYFKGVDILIRAFAKINLLFPNTKLIIIGQGDLIDYYKNLAKQLKIEKKISFLSKVENRNLPSYYQRADIFVLPSINQSEAFGIVSLEAMACGCPIIVSDLPGVRTLVKGNGFVFKPANVEDLVKKIKILLSNSQVREKMGEESSKIALKNFTWSKITKKLLSIYEKGVFSDNKNK